MPYFTIHNFQVSSSVSPYFKYIHWIDDLPFYYWKA